MWHKQCRTFHPWCPCIKTRCLLVHCAKDTESAHCFKDFIRRIIDPSEDNTQRYVFWTPLTASVKICGVWQPCGQIHVCFFLLITDNFLEDPFCQMMQDELIMTTICNGDERWKVIPVYSTRPANRIPLGTRAINAISVSRIIYTGSMTSTLPILTQDNIERFDRFFAKYLKNLFASKQHLRLKREEADLKRLELWLFLEREKGDGIRQGRLLRQNNGIQWPRCVCREPEHTWCRSSAAARLDWEAPCVYW